ncbi:hypothetical protein SSABA_v1c08000 [Spiroplasma sabaudiense Ar-1343]|uniref:Transmembrane protein n=1 Tax=Spiroplasma sabaudiense Ar-1343 TaxID=1276257 RepID=W6AB42_9MOLU|nr:phage minor capsid protein [Spiroplasma sabaudiense]AHI54201.1 hypothetical protein SSABA_v1c08000 [Spiroplasma sabaudiense Ar-1343]
MNTIISYSSNEITNLPWWVILVIIIFVLLLLAFIPWNKISKKSQTKQVAVEKVLDEKIKNENNTPYMGMYNWFGKKQSLRLSKVVYVKEEEDSCELCRPWENTVIIIADEHSQAPTMREAIAAGYHHVGCKHIDLDYFEGVTKIPENKFSLDHKEKRFSLRLEQYKFEQDLRDLNYQIEREIDLKKQSLHKDNLKKLTERYLDFLSQNQLKRNFGREDPLVDDISRFS